MTHQNELIRDALRLTAEHAPGDADLLEGTRHRIESRRRRARLIRAATVTGLTLVAVVGVSIGTHPGLLPPSGGNAVPATVAPRGNDVTDATPSATGRGRLTSCVRGYSLRTLATAAGFAFDGTITAVTLPDSTDTAVLPQARVTFAVHHAYRGLEGPTTTVLLVPPGTSMRGMLGDGSPATYRVGDRLLVSGALATNRATAHQAWWGCGGFTRSYTPAAAAGWARALTTGHATSAAP